MGTGTLAVLVWTMPGQTAECAAGASAGYGESSVGSGADNDDAEISKEVDEVEALINNTVGPLITKLGYGGVMGMCSGYALKKVGKIAAFFVGLGFVGFQIAQYQGLIQIDYLEVEKKVTKVLDADGDGKLTTKDLIMWWRQLKGILTHSLPSAGGFSSGFALGVYSG
jgi:FUN14 domain-containing protein 1